MVNQGTAASIVGVAVEVAPSGPRYTRCTAVWIALNASPDGSKRRPKAAVRATGRTPPTSPASNPRMTQGRGAQALESTRELGAHRAGCSAERRRDLGRREPVQQRQVQRLAVGRVDARERSAQARVD